MGQRVVDADQVIDELPAEIELAVWDRMRGAPPDWEHLQQAVGLRLILPELERSADLAEHIAQRSLTGVGAEMTPISRGIIQRMSEVAIDMWNRGAKAYTERTVHFEELDEADERTRRTPRAAQQRCRRRRYGRCRRGASHPPVTFLRTAG